METPISIIIPAHNQLAYCRQCLESIRLNTRRAHALVLVDNGSTDGVGEYFDGVPGARVVHAPVNRGFAGGVNLGLAAAEPGHVVLLNSDTLVPEGWLTRLEAALLRADDLGMVGPMSNYVSGPQLIPDLTFETLDDVNRFAEQLARERAGRLTETERLVGFCMMIRDAARAAVGPWDESFGLGNYEDDDYCLRVARAGYRLGVAEDCFVFHYGNRTFLGMDVTGERWDALMEANRRRFLEKWHQPPPPRADALQTSKRLNTEAREACARGDLVEAARRFVQAIEACPQLEINYNDLGAVLWELGERDRAYQHFVKAVQLNRDYAEARDNLREAAEALDRRAEAQALLGGA